MKWNDRLRQARDAAKLKNTDIAQALKVSDPTVNGWMTGKTVNIEARHLLPACRLLGVSPYWVLLGEESESDVGHLSQAIKVGAFDIIRLIALFASASEEGKRFILEAAETAEKA